MQIIKIYKRGCNVEIAIFEDSLQKISYFEDSSNVFLQFNPLNFTINISIKTNTQFVTDNISLLNCFYFNVSGSDILITNESDFTLNYALVFACATGGGGGGGGLLTADNGLTANSSTNVQLGGALIQNTTVSGNSYLLNIVGSCSQIPNALVNFENTYNNINARGLNVIAPFGRGIICEGSLAGIVGRGTGPSGTGASFTSDLNIGMTVASLSFIAGSFTSFYASNNKVETVLQLFRNPIYPTTSANGIGAGISYVLPDSNGYTYEAGEIAFIWSDYITTQRKSTFQVFGVYNNTRYLLSEMSYLGFKLNKYGNGTHSGTVAYLLGVDASGNVIETASGGGGGLLTADNGLTANSSTNVQLGGTLLQNTLIDFNSNNLEFTNSNYFSVMGLGASLIVDSLNKTIKTVLNGNDYGFYCNDQGGGFLTTFIGNTSGINNGVYLSISDFDQTIILNNTSGTVFNGFIINQSALDYTFGNDSLFIKLYGNKNYILEDFTTGVFAHKVDFTNGINNLGFISTAPDVLITIFESGIIQTSYDNIQKGIKFDFINNLYFFGDSSLYVTLASDLAELTYILQDSTGLSGIYIDYLSQINYVGWLSGSQDLSLQFNLSTGKITSFYNFNPSGLDLDLINGIFLLGLGVSGISINDGLRIVKIGDSLGNGNGNFIEVNDSLETIKLKTANGNYNFANIQAYTDNADAIANGLSVGDLYRHSGLGESQDQLRIVH